jgi:hypothetical protein
MSALVDQVEPQTEAMVVLEERSNENPLVIEATDPKSRIKLSALSLVLNPRIRFPGVSTAPLADIAQRPTKQIRRETLRGKRDIKQHHDTTRGRVGYTNWRLLHF